jgi:hypothetical protein
LLRRCEQAFRDRRGRRAQRRAGVVDAGVPVQQLPVTSDGGGRVAAARTAFQGAERIARITAAAAAHYRDRVRATVTAVNGVPGGVARSTFVWPHSFYDNVLGVDRLPSYSQHLLTDVGGFYLGFAVLFAWAAVDRGRALVLATCAAWIVVQALHLAYRVTHLEHFSVATAFAQTVLLAAAPAVAVAAALLGARASGRRTRGRDDRDQAAWRP